MAEKSSQPTPGVAEERRERVGEQELLLYRIRNEGLALLEQAKTKPDLEVATAIALATGGDPAYLAIVEDVLVRANAALDESQP